MAPLMCVNNEPLMVSMAMHVAVEMVVEAAAVIQSSELCKHVKVL